MIPNYPQKHPIQPRLPLLRNISHAGHLIATILTAGLWAPFWALAAMNTSRINKNKMKQYALEMSRYDEAKAEWTIARKEYL